MAVSRVIEVSFGRSSVALVRIDTAYFYNNGIIFKPTDLDLPASYQVHWADSPQASSTLETIGTSEGAPIPDDLWDRSRVIYGWIYLHPTENSAVTAYEVRIYKNVRAGLPDGTEPTPAEQSTIDQLISALNGAVEQTGQDVESAQASAEAAESAKTAAESARDTAGEYANDAESSAASASASASQASTSATASAQSASQSAQIKSDVEDLADYAQGYAQASAQSATASANSATQAQGFANSASASAQFASGYASNAQASANTANTKASEASISASTASTKAIEASQSAENALSYKTDAESAKTASQTAQGLAESARDTAVSAKDDAESARDDAETARDAVQSSAAQITTNAEDITQLKEDLTNAAKLESIDLTNVDTSKCYDTQTVGASPTETSSSNYYSQIISVKSGEIYYVTGKGASAYRLWALTDSQMVILSNAPSLYTVENERILIEQNGYLYLNFNKSAAYSIKKEQSAFIDEFNAIHEVLRTYNDDITSVTARVCYNTATVGQTAERSASSNYVSQVVSVKRGDVFYITGQVAQTSNYKLWACVDSAGIVTKNCGTTYQASDEKITVESDGYLYVNFHKNYVYSLKALSISGTIIGNGSLDEIKIANLYKKSMLNFGDSIAAGNGNTETGESVGYADMIASKYYMSLADYAVGGATITKYSGANNYIETQVDTAITEHSGESFDFILIDGGTNDVNNAPIGSLVSGYDTMNCDNTTLMGSLEIIFNKLRTAFPLSNIIYVIVHKMTSRSLEKQINYHEAIIEACEKWSIPYVDIFNDGQITSFIPSLATTCFPVNESTETGYDSTHPNKVGYEKFYNPPIIAKMKSMIM